LYSKFGSLLRPKSQQAFVSLTLGFAPGKSTNEKTCAPRLRMARDEPGTHSLLPDMLEQTVDLNSLGLLCPFQILLSLVKLLGQALVLEELLAEIESLHVIFTVYFTSRLSEENCHKLLYFV
jgi:hypothetical protein